MRARTRAGLAWRYGRDFARDLTAAQTAGEPVVVRRTTWKHQAGSPQATFQVKLGGRAWQTVGDRQAHDVMALRAKPRR